MVGSARWASAYAVLIARNWHARGREVREHLLGRSLIEADEGVDADGLEAAAELGLWSHTVMGKKLGSDGGPWLHFL